jgi:hypothetical protein
VAADAASQDRIARGVAPATVELQGDLVNKSDASFARHDRPGAITARLAQAGSGLLLPDLIQNIADRPLEEVQQFFQQLLTLPSTANIDSLRAVFSWYKDDFIGGLDYESDPVAAWKRCGSLWMSISQIHGRSLPATRTCGRC